MNINLVHFFARYEYSTMMKIHNNILNTHVFNNHIIVVELFSLLHVYIYILFK